MSFGDTTGLGRDVSDDGTAEFDSARTQVGGDSARGVSLQHISWSLRFLLCQDRANIARSKDYRSGRFLLNQAHYF